MIAVGKLADEHCIFASATAVLIQECSAGPHYKFITRTLT